MIQLLSRWLIHDRDNVSSPAVRRAYGTLCGAVGIALNILLFAGKFFAGQLSGSIAVTADAFNNLSDAGSSAVTLLGFRLAGKKPDTDHPFGHGRIEYISGLIVAGLILLMGVELAKSSLDKILHPEEVTFSLLALGIMAASVCVKLYMWLYNRQVGRRIHSAAMEATAMDSLSDTASTFAVLVAMLIGKWTAMWVLWWRCSSCSPRTRPPVRHCPPCWDRRPTRSWCGRYGTSLCRTTPWWASTIWWCTTTAPAG